MPSKTDRILGYLPPTFRALPRPTALYALADAFGNELQQAENAMAAVMLAHWVDRADLGAEFIQDLACMASLYGLAPRGASIVPDADAPSPACPAIAADETVEEFRAHLKRYVRTFLQGTVTVQGILRVCAEALGLVIGDDYDAFDAWWTRGDEAFTIVEERDDSAARAIFGANALKASGSPASAARIQGNVDLSAGVDLHGASALEIACDGGAPVSVDLSAHVNDPPDVFAQEIAKAIGSAVPALNAHVDNGRLILASRTAGSVSRLELQDVDGDASPRLLGLPARKRSGSAAAAATLTGTSDLSGGVDMSEEAAPRYLRLRLNGKSDFEIDCSSGTPGVKSAGDIVHAVNDQTALPLAATDGKFITLTSPSAGFAGSIEIQNAAAQDVAAQLFGSAPRFVSGSDAQAARITGLRDLSQGVDLTTQSTLQVSIDGAARVTVACAGANPAQTQLNEIVDAINKTLGAEFATQDGRFPTLASRSTGTSSTVAFPSGTGADTVSLIFGLPPRTALGADATPATISGATDLHQGLDAGGHRFLSISVDGEPPVTIDLRVAVAYDPVSLSRIASPQQIADAINAAVGRKIAATDGTHLTLTSPTVGGAGSIAIPPLQAVRRSDFVTRAFIASDASRKVLGLSRAIATGIPATSARVRGTADLSRGVDLSRARALRLSIDGTAARDLDCAARSPRPRAALAEEIVAAINEQLGKDIASTDGRALLLSSQIAGPGSRIEFGTGGNARQKLFGQAPPTAQGSDATGVTFRATVDASAGIDLSSADRIKLSVDGTTAEISCAGPDPAHTTLTQIAARINVALGGSFASIDGSRLVINSSLRGSQSRIDIDVPSASDATKSILGVSAPRSYHGSDAKPAIIAGTTDVSAAQDLRAVRFLRVALNGAAPVDIDCAGTNPAATTLDDLVQAIDRVIPNLASHDAAHLIVTSPAAGASSRIDLQDTSAGDARSIVLGQVSDVTVGTAPEPATLTGTVDLLSPVDLTEHSLIRLAIDGGAAETIDIRGAAPDRTSLHEIVLAIDARIAGVADATDNDRLRLTSPTVGETSTVELQPVRALEVIDFPPVRTCESHSVRHGDTWVLNNDGACAAEVQIQIDAPAGEDGAQLVNLSDGLRMIAEGAISPNRPARAFVVRPIGAYAAVPFEGERALTIDDLHRGAAIVLGHALAATAVELRARRPRSETGPIAIRVREANPPTAPAPSGADGAIVAAAGRLVRGAAGYQLTDAGGTAIAAVRGTWPGAVLSRYENRMVSVTGALYAGSAEPTLVADRIAQLFDVTLQNEAYDAVTIGQDYPGAKSLAERINTESQLVRAISVNLNDAVRLARGQSSWVYADCDDARFDRDRFNQAHAAGGLCIQRGIFGVSTFTNGDSNPAAVFTLPPPLTDAPVNITFCMPRCIPGAFTVNLPADLPDEFGGRFDSARFTTAAAPESYAGVVVDPHNDPDNAAVRMAGKSTLVTVANVDRVPIGWEALEMPFRHPRTRLLTLGSAGAQARMYLSDPGASGFIELRAIRNGDWGNGIAVTARPAGPARFDVTVSYDEARFENARITALAGTLVPPSEAVLPALVADILKPRPIGVMHAKAAGIRAAVSRDRTDPHSALAR